MSWYNNFEAVIAPKLIITTAGTLKAHVAFKKKLGSSIIYLVETSEETLIEEILKIKMHGVYKVQGYENQETFVGADGNSKISKTITPSNINFVSANSNKALLLLLYKYAINNYYNKDLVVAYTPLNVVEEEFEKLYPYTRYLKDVMPKDMEKEYEEHTKKTWEYVDKLCTLRFSSN